MMKKTCFVHILLDICYVISGNNDCSKCPKVLNLKHAMDLDGDIISDIFIK